MSVYKSINAVQDDLAKEGITKNRKNTQQGFNFRGIDDVYNALSPLLAKHGLCIIPRMLSRQCTERATQKGGTLFYVVVEAEFDFVCAIDGSMHTARTFGEAMDSADKATNKAMSAAYKYAAFQAFCIPTEGDNDADAHTPPPIVPHNNAPKQTPKPATAPAPEPMISDGQRKMLMALYGDCPREERLADATEILRSAKPGAPELKSFNDLTGRAAAWLIDRLEEMQGRKKVA